MEEPPANDAEFEEFWDVYRNDLHKAVARGAAVKAYAAARKKASAADILAGLRRYVESDWRRDQMFPMLELRSSASLQQRRSFKPSTGRCSGLRSAAGSWPPNSPR